MGGQRLQRICTFRVIVLEKEISNSVIQGIVEASFSLEGISLAESAGFEEELYNFVVSAQTCLQSYINNHSLESRNAYTYMGNLTNIKGV
jgi:hypothetical protein